MKILPIKKQLLFFERLALLIRSNIDLSEAVQFLSEHESDKDLKKFLITLQYGLNSGKTIGTSLQNSPWTITSNTVDFIDSALINGSLEQTLEGLITDLRRIQDLKHKIAITLIYPVIILLLTLGLCTFLLLFVVPNLEHLFSSMHTTLPLITRSLILISRFIRYRWYVIFIFICALLATYRLIFTGHSGRKRLQTVLMRIPKFNTVLRKYYLLSFFKTLHLYFSQHISLEQSLTVSAQQTSSIEFKRTIRLINADTVTGISLGESCAKHPKFFDSLTLNLIRSAEKSGSLQNIFQHLAVMFEADIHKTIKLWSTITEPLLISIMGLCVGTIALAIILPMYQITQHLNA